LKIKFSPEQFESRVFEKAEHTEAAWKYR
jgi:hypothetical protein